jgi:hypothetical protein
VVNKQEHYIGIHIQICAENSVATTNLFQHYVQFSVPDILKSRVMTQVSIAGAFLMGCELPK